jgi:glutamyl-tRNA synthetase
VEKTVRVRFAPSPTGFLHIGGARTALFNLLYARHNRGIFVLRIEDTDKTRSTDEYISAIIDGMKWLGLDWDEGPFRQTERIDVYAEYLNRLIRENRAYYCYCSPEKLEAKRKEAMAQGNPVKYDGTCRNLKEPVQGVQPAVRFRMPQEGQTSVVDLIRGKVVFENSQLDDLIISRSDGTPTYNFTVVVDDIDMNISHVIRGDDHLNNTPKQIQLYTAFGFEVPKFAHLPMILGSDRARLSKRHGATAVMSYYEMGYLPEALVNYLVRLGWSYGDQEVFTREELIRYFSFENVGKAAAVFNPEKLLWLNGQYIMSAPAQKLVELVTPFLEQEGIIQKGQQLDREWMARAVETLKERKLLIDFKDRITSLSDFSAVEIEKIFRAIAEEKSLKLGKLAQPVRVAMTGGTASPGIFEVLEIVGKEKTLRRLEKAIEMIKKTRS